MASTSPWDNDPIVTPAPNASATPWANDPIVDQHPVSGPSDSLLTDAGRFAGTAGANAMAGLLSFPHLITQGVDWVGNKFGANVGADAALSSVQTPDGQPLVPDFQTARNMAFNTTGGTEYQPQTWLGRRGMDAATAGIMSLTDPAAIPAAMGAGAAGGEGAELLPDHPIVGALAGGLFGGMAVNGLLNTAQRVPTAITNANPNDTYAAFKNQGLPTKLAGTTTGDPMLLNAEKFASRMSGSEADMADARSDLLNSWQDRLGQIADRIGTSSTPAEAGQVLQTDANNWLSNFKQGTGQLWQDFSSKVPPTTPTPVTNYQQALTDVLGKFPGAPATAAVVQPGTLKNLSDALGVDLQGGNSLPWQAVQSLRTAIGEKLENPTTVADTSQAALRQLYGGLSQDMQSGAANVSPDAFASFIKANAATAAGHNVLDAYLNPILKAPSAEAAGQYAMAQARQGGDRLEGLALNLPNAQGALGSYALRNAATNTESPTSFATAMAGRKPLYSPEARNVLFPDPQTQSDIGDMVTAGRAMMPVEKDLANSPTATHQTRGLPARIIAGSELGQAGAEMFGTPGRIGGWALGLTAPTIGGRLSQLTALNPLMARMYGQNLPIDLSQPGLTNRLMIGGAVGQK
jgi:hypothetical protein